MFTSSDLASTAGATGWVAPWLIGDEVLSTNSALGSITSIVGLATSFLAVFVLVLG